MVHNEKLDKVCHDFLLLNEDRQDYILGILQALVFAKNSGDQFDSQSESENTVPNTENNGQGI